MQKSLISISLCAVLVTLSGACSARSVDPLIMRSNYSNASALLESPGYGTQLAEHKLQYVVEDLGTLGGVGATAEVISNDGSVLGTSDLPGDTAVHGFVWRDGMVTDLGTLGGLNSDERGVPLSDGHGLIAGSSQIAEVDPLGEYWGLSAFLCNF